MRDRARRDGPRGDGHARGHAGASALSQATTPELARRGVQRLDAVVGDHDDVLDPNAELAVEVDPRFDAERHPGFEHRVIARRRVRRLVHLEADPVPGPVDEPIAEPGGLDHRSGRSVDGLDLDPRADDLRRRALRVRDDRVDAHGGARPVRRRRPCASCRCGSRRPSRRSRARPRRRRRSCAPLARDAATRRWVPRRRS